MGVASPSQRIPPLTARFATSPRSRALTIQSAVFLFSFGIIATLAADNAGYWPSAWGWGTVVLLLASAATLVAAGDCSIGPAEWMFSLSLLAFAAWTLASGLWSPSFTQPALASERALLYASGAFAILVLLRVASASSVVCGVWAAISTICCYSLLTRLLPERLGSFDDLAGYRLEAPLGYWNALGIFAALGTVVACGIAARAQSVLLRAIAAASTIVVVSTLYFTFSRGAWIALAAGIAAAIVLDPRRLQFIFSLLTVVPWVMVALWRGSGSEPLTHLGSGLRSATHAGHAYALTVLMLGAASAATTVAVGFLESRVSVPRRVERIFMAGLLVLVIVAVALATLRFGSPVTIGRKVYDGFTGENRIIKNGNLNGRLLDLSLSGRTTHWHVAWREYRAHPWLGSGGGSFERYWNEFRPAPIQVRNAHNLYLETLAEVGPFGLGMLCLALAIPLLAAVTRRRSALVPAAAGAYVVFLVHAAVDWDWQMPAVVLAALFLGAAIVGNRPIGRPRASMSVPLRAAVVVGVVLLGAAAFVTLRGNQAIAASRHAAAHAQWLEAASKARAAQRWSPWSTEPWQLLGEAQAQQGDQAAARRSFRHALQKNSADWSIWLDLAVSSSGSSRRRAIAAASRLNPRSPEIASWAPGAPSIP